MSEALVVVLDHTLRDLVFYAVGILINVTSHTAESLSKVLENGLIDKLVDVLRDSNIEDMELSKVASKALLNLVGQSAFWKTETIEKLDQVLQNLGEELDSIIVSMAANNV